MSGPSRVVTLSAVLEAHFQQVEDDGVAWLRQDGAPPDMQTAFRDAVRQACTVATTALVPELRTGLANIDLAAARGVGRPALLFRMEPADGRGPNARPMLAVLAVGEGATWLEQAFKAYLDTDTSGLEILETSTKGGSLPGSAPWVGRTRRATRWRQ